MSFHDELTAAFGPEPMAAGPGVPGGLLRGVFRGLTDQGVKVGSLTMWITIVTLVIELVQEVGPKVEEIVKLIRERLKV